MSQFPGSVMDLVTDIENSLYDLDAKNSDTSVQAALQVHFVVVVHNRDHRVLQTHPDRSVLSQTICGVDAASQAVRSVLRTVGLICFALMRAV